MNIERINRMIERMSTLTDDQLYMAAWQTGHPTQFKLTDKEAVTCGTAACVAGWLALDPEFQEAGGVVSKNFGYPIIGNNFRTNAVAAWLDIDEDTSKGLCATNALFKIYLYTQVDANLPASNGYGYIPAADIKPHHVVTALKMIRDGWTVENSEEKLL